MVAALALAGLAALVLPRLEAARRATAEREARQAAVAARGRRERIVAEQRPRFGRAAPARAASAEAERRARRVLLTRVEAAITADARERVRTGELRASGLRGTRCVPYPRSLDRAAAPERDLRRRSGTYDCLAVIRPVAGGRGTIGYPFRAVVHFRTGRYAWCKTNPVPGERVVPDPRTVVRLPAACAGASR